MRAFFALCKVSFKGLLLASSQHRKAGKKASSGLGVLFLLAAVCLYISGVYSFMLAGAFADAGYLDLVYTLMITSAAGGSFLFCLFNAAGFVFGGKDTDFLLSLPVKDVFLVLSRVMALYLENLFFSFCFLAPAVAAVIWAGGPIASSVLMGVLVLLLVPLLPSAAALLAAYFVSWFESRGRYRTLVRTVGYLAFFGLTMVGSLKLNMSLESALLNVGDLALAMRQTLGLFHLGADAMYSGNFVSLLWFALFCVLPFVLIVFLLSVAFRPLVGKLSGKAFSTNYKLTEQKANSAFAALYKKELHRYINSTMYLMNTAIGMFIMVGGCIAMLFSPVTVITVSTAMGDLFLPLLALAGGVMAAMSCITSPSISLEGNRLWVLKAAPILEKTIFDAKLALQLTVTWPAFLLCGILLAAGGFISLSESILLVLLCGIASAIIGELGLLCNLKLPKLDGANDTVIVKQSASVLLAMVAGALLCAGMALIFQLLRLALPVGVVLWILILPLGVLFVISRRVLMTYGAKLFSELI